MNCENCGKPIGPAGMAVDVDNPLRQEIWCMTCIANLEQIAAERGDVLGKHITTDDEAKANGWDEEEPPS